MPSKIDFRERYHHIPLAREGLPILGYAAFTTLILALLGQTLLTLLSLVVTLFIGHFFRDPERVLPAGHDSVVSPADGRVIGVERSEEPCFTHHSCWKISIFMSVFDVHVNRIPISGRVEGVHYQTGKFFAANRLRASRKNEQNWLHLRDDADRDIVLTQVAGLIARRIVCWPSPGEEVIRGERFGMIRFGSRLDVYVPANSEILVSKGDRVLAGGNNLCHLK